MDQSLALMQSDRPIDLTTDDILLYIFDIFIGPSVDWGYYSPDAGDPVRVVLPSPIGLSHVCRRWRNVVLSYSPFWSRINTSSPTATQVFLERSGKTSIDVFLAFPPPWQNLVDIIVPHSSRLRQLYLRVRRTNEQDPSFPELNFNRAPHLNSLILRTSYWRGGSPPRILSSEIFPSLKMLRLDRVPVTRDAGFTHLTHLYLKGGVCRIATVLPLLKGNPALEVFTYFSRRDDREVARPANPRVYLPSVRWMQLYGSTELLHHISFPTDTSLSIVIPMVPDGSFFITGPIQRLCFGQHGSFIAVTEGCGHVEYDDPGALTPRDAVRKFGIWLNREVLIPTHVDGLKELWFPDNHQHISYVDWRSALHYMPSLSRIFVSFGSCTFIIELLTPEQDQPIVCPALRELDLCFTLFSFAKLVECLEGRDRRGFRLHKLEMLVLVPIKIEDAERLKQHVDELSVLVRPLSHPLPRMEISEVHSAYKEMHSGCSRALSAFW